MPRLSSFTLTLLLCLGLPMMAACDRESGDAAQQEAAPTAATEPVLGEFDRSYKGNRIPDLTFADPEGRKLRLVELTGTPVLLNLWATWCAPCVKEMPTLEKLAASQKGKLRVVTVSQDMKGAEAVTPFFAEQGLEHLEPWLNPDTSLAFHYGGGTLPMTILFDAEGREVWRFAGDHDWTGADVPAMLAEAGD